MSREKRELYHGYGMRRAENVGMRVEKAALDPLVFEGRINIPPGSGRRKISTDAWQGLLPTVGQIAKSVRELLAPKHDRQTQLGRLGGTKKGYPLGRNGFDIVHFNA